MNSLSGFHRDKTCLWGFPTKRVSTQSPKLKRLAIKNEVSLVASLGMLLSEKQITKALINPRGCAGWSVPLLFANPKDIFPV